MSHNKSRSGVSASGVDWNDPHLNSLLEKTASWRLDNRSNLPPREVEIHINSGWVTANTVRKPALVLARNDETMVLATRFPIQQGDRVGVDSLRNNGTPIVWKVIEAREGHRTEDREHGLFLSWLRLD